MNEFTCVCCNETTDQRPTERDVCMECAYSFDRDIKRSKRQQAAWNVLTPKERDGVIKYVYMEDYVG